MSTIKSSFWIGTEAELIKVFPIMLEMEKRNLAFNVISTGQNDILKSKLLNLFSGKLDIQLLSHGPKRKSSVGLLLWFIQTFFISLVQVPRAKKQILFIHGDTVSTLMGAIVGWIKGFKIAHVEAGLRSFNFWKPFPEEIDRVISSKFVDYHFCPNDEAVTNLKDTSGEKINTRYNTLFDSLNAFKKQNRAQAHSQQKDYFVFVLHRQENLFDDEFVKSVIQLVLEKCQTIHCKFILHEPTKNKLAQLGLLSSVENNKNITTYPRMPYFDFMEILVNAKFLVSDGGSNQEESFYLGLPCLIMRTETERSEGLKSNVILERKNIDKIRAFFDNYTQYKKEIILSEAYPSAIIVDYVGSLHEL
jgi:UDP-N-acetylglucosamine 2-epimerase (non-hydrolysing)